MTDVVIVAEPPPPPPLSTANAVKGAVTTQSTTKGLVTNPKHGVRVFVHLASKQIFLLGMTIPDQLAQLTSKQT